MSTENLDRICAQFGWEMCDLVSKQYGNKGEAAKVVKSKTENLITKSLGVLQEDGVYAFFLFLASQSASDLAKKAADLLREVQIMGNYLSAETNEVQDILEAIRKKDGLADNLDCLLLAKKLLEQALIYARYHAKALEG